MISLNRFTIVLTAIIAGMVLSGCETQSQSQSSPQTPTPPTPPSSSSQPPSSSPPPSSSSSSPPSASPSMPTSSPSMPSSSSQSQSQQQASNKKGSEGEQSQSEQQAGGQEAADNQSQAGAEPSLETTDDMGSDADAGDQLEPGDPSDEIALEETEEAAAESIEVDLGSMDPAGAESSLEELLEALESASQGGSEGDIAALPPSGAAAGSPAEQESMEAALEAMEQGRGRQPPPAGGQGDPGEGSDGGSGGDLESVLARAEAGGGGIDAELAVLNQALEESLVDFDGEILGGRQSAQARDAERGSTGTDIAKIDEEQTEGDVGSEGEQGNGGLYGDMSSGTGNRPDIPQTARKGDYENAPGAAAVPSDIPDGSDDDVVARQIREAALKERDPELREKLWEEYRKYKASQ